MQANSAPNSAPASKPARHEPSRWNSGMPRHKHHSHNKAVAPPKRKEAWNIGGISAIVALISTCCRPQNRQQPSSSEMAKVSRWALRALTDEGFTKDVQCRTC